MAPSTQKAAAAAPPKPASNDTSTLVNPPNGPTEGTVNRKKQKRRQKEAARRAAEQGLPAASGTTLASGPTAKGQAASQLPPYAAPDCGFSIGTLTKWLDSHISPSHSNDVPGDEQLYYSDEDTQ